MNTVMVIVFINGVQVVPGFLAMPGARVGLDLSVGDRHRSGSHPVSWLAINNYAL